MTEMTATELARNLSDVLNRVADGEEIRITRGGRPIALIGPSRRQWVNGSDFLAMLRDLPTPDPGFAADLKRIREEANALPERSTPIVWD